MEFMRAISIVLIAIHVYWFCYRAFVDAGINIGVVDKILLNFQRTAGLFSNLLVTKVFAMNRCASASAAAIDFASV